MAPELRAERRETDGNPTYLIRPLSRPSREPTWGGKAFARLLLVRQPPAIPKKIKTPKNRKKKPENKKKKMRKKKKKKKKKKNGEMDQQAPRRPRTGAGAPVRSFAGS